MKVLVVEDEDRIAAFLAKGLRASGLEVDCVATGTGALALLARQDTDVVVLDLGLPDIDGLEVLRLARQADACLPVIVATARSEPADRRRSEELGAGAYLVKPFSFGRLLATVRSFEVPLEA